MIPDAIAQELTRLVGQEVAVEEDRYTITNVAGEGRPLVGIVERRGQDLWLVPTDADEGTAAVRLTGPLAHPRIAGPGYKVWVLGEMEGEVLRAKRLGVLRPPKGR